MSNPTGVWLPQHCDEMELKEYYKLCLSHVMSYSYKINNVLFNLVALLSFQNDIFDVKVLVVLWNKKFQVSWRLFPMRHICRFFVQGDHCLNKTLLFYTCLQHGHTEFLLLPILYKYKLTLHKHSCRQAGRNVFRKGSQHANQVTVSNISFPARS